MFLFFHDIGFPWWAELAMLLIVVFCFLLTVRGIYILFTRTPRQTFIYLGTVIGIFSIIWVTFLVTNSDTLQIVCFLFGFPFGFFAGMPFLMFIDPPESLTYFGATFLNLAAVCGVIEFIERIISRARTPRIH
jgi:hypothetical protein